MKMYCPSCGHLVADISKMVIRKGAVMVCAKCMARYEAADRMAKLAREQTKKPSNDMPEFMRGIFQ